MIRRTLLATALGLAAALFTATTFASDRSPAPARCDRDLTQTIVALERLAWDVCKIGDYQTAERLYPDTFIETLADGSLATREDIVSKIESGVFKVYYYTMSEISVVRASPTCALISYRILVNYDWYGVNYLDDLRATSVYLKEHGRWRCHAYHETYILPVEE